MKPSLEMKCYLCQGSHVREEKKKDSDKNPQSSTKRYSVGNIKPDIPYSVGKTCHKHISQHPSLRSRKSVTMCMENSANPE